MTSNAVEDGDAAVPDGVVVQLVRPFSENMGLSRQGRDFH